MPFTSPIALLGLLFVPAVLAMYMLKLRRDEAVVPSTLLWTRLVADVEANAPWQRLRRSLLLLVQLLLVAILALLAARPFLERPAGLARDVVLVLDTSASMAATDVAPSRLEAAKAAALDALRDLPTGGRVSVIAADRTARIVVNETTDLGRVRQALSAIRPSNASGNLGDAIELAGKLAARSGDAQLLVGTDGALATPPTSTVEAPVKVLAVGRSHRNQALVALAVRTSPSAVTRSVFISIANLDLDYASRRIELRGPGGLIEVRDVRLDPQARADVVIDDVPADIGTLEVRLVGSDPAATAAPDDLAVDDTAWAVVPATQQRNVLLVSDGDPYLETALGYLPDVHLFGVTPDRYPADAARTDGSSWDLIIFEGTLPAALPATPILAVAPPGSSALGQVAGTITNPGIGSLSPDEPILRYVDLSTTHIAEAARMTLPDWARTIIPGPGGAPLLYTGVRSGLPAAVLAFEPRRSDLPLQVAFPILLANLTGELMGGSTAPSEAVQPGSPVSLTIPPDATGLSVTRPDGSVVELVPPSPETRSVSFTGTDLLGIYSVAPRLAAATSTATPAAAGSVTPSAALPEERAPQPFAVDLFDVDESTIAPGSAATIEALGRVPAASPGPSGPTGGTGATAAAARPTARDELWIPIVLIVLVALCVEWAVYQRDAVVRIRRGLAARFGRRPADGRA